MSPLHETIAAVATAYGRGGVAVVRVSGSEAFDIARALTRKEPRPGRVVFTRFHKGETVVDEGLLLAFKAPRSFTGEDVVEFHTHGGTVAPRRVLESALSLGARLAMRGEFTQRAFLNGRMTFEQAESLLDFIDAKTDRAADAALQGLIAGENNPDSPKTAVRGLYDESVRISSTIEYSLDVDDSDLPEGFFESVQAEVEGLRTRLRELAAKLRQRRMLREGALIVLAGPPNAGKSSLLNALLGERRAIVSEIAGTTRDSIEAWTDFGGWPVRLVDTAGLRKDGAGFGEIEAEGVRRSGELAEKADVVIVFGEIDLPLHNKAPEKVLRICPKCDLQRGAGLNVSAVTGEGVNDLKREVARRLEVLSPCPDETDGSDNERYLSAVLRAEGVLGGLSSVVGDGVLMGNLLRTASSMLGEVIGADYSDDLLTNLFSRFCVGK